MYFNSGVAVYQRCRSLFLLMHMYSTIYLETDLISGKNLASHLTLSYIFIGSNDSLDSIWHSRIYDFQVI